MKCISKRFFVPFGESPDEVISDFLSQISIPDDEILFINTSTDGVSGAYRIYFLFIYYK